MNINVKSMAKVLERAVKEDLIMSREKLTLAVCIVNTLKPESIQRLSEFDRFNFAHDILGMLSHYNEKTGDFDDFFVPRCM